MNICIVGSTGLVGKELLKLCEQNPSIQEILLPVRSQPSWAPSFTKARWKLVNFEQPNWALEALEHGPWEHCFCALGTTIKKARSPQAFEKIDRELVVQFAQAAKQIRVKSFGVVSALGADPTSTVFYNRVKGQMETDLRNLKLNRLVIARPSLLLGERAESRPLEQLMVKLNPVFKVLLKGPLKTYSPIEGKKVAEALLTEALKPEPSQNQLIVLENLDLLQS